MSNKYRVFYSTYEEFYIDIEADNASDAIDEARGLDGGDFESAGLGSWEFERVEEA